MTSTVRLTGGHHRRSSSSADWTKIPFIFALLAFAVFIVRPFGALVFSRLGDMVQVHLPE
jgi:hypothetical protein